MPDPSDASIAQSLDNAHRLFRAGQFQQAELIIRQVLQAAPSNARAHHLLGRIAHAVGKFDIAVDLFNRSIALSPEQSGTFLDLGNSLMSLGRIDQAIAAFRRSIALRPDFGGTHSNLGIALAMLGRIDEAAGAFGRAAELCPDQPEVHQNFATAIAKQGRLDEAIAAYRRAIALRPDYADAHNNLGTVFSVAGRLDLALEHIAQAVRCAPQHGQYLSNLVMLLIRMKRMGDAVRACTDAIARDRNNFDAYASLGRVLSFTGQIDEAAEALNRAIALRPNDADAHNHLANALKESGRVPEAIAVLRKARQIDPNHALAHQNLASFLAFDPAVDPAEGFDEHRRWDAAHALPLTKLAPPHGNDRSPTRRLRIGYVSPDFREHSVSYFIGGLLAAHDRSAVEVFCYADLTFRDDTTERLRLNADHWRDITSVDAAATAHLIRNDQIDILVDLSGHTANSRLLTFARKPAPVQVTYLGYPGTTGITAIDYVITDRWIDPPGMTERYFSERLVRLPETFACYTPQIDAPAVSPLPAAANGFITFASYNTLQKVNERVIACWSEILRRTPASRLMMMTRGLQGDATSRRIRDAFAKNGIAADRLDLRGYRNVGDYLASHSNADFLLDTFPVNGHTITCHAAWMGLPTVSLAGATHGGRLGASVLTNLGLTELLASSTDDYIRIAVELAGDVPRLESLRRSLRQRMTACPLMDAPRFARHLESAYRRMWQSYCAAAPPTPIDLSL